MAREAEHQKTLLRKQAKLRRMMATHQLKSHDVAKLTLYQPQTVRMWMCGQREVPERAFRLLDFELGKRERA